MKQEEQHHNRAFWKCRGPGRLPSQTSSPPRACPGVLGAEAPSQGACVPPAFMPICLLQAGQQPSALLPAPFWKMPVWRVEGPQGLGRAGWGAQAGLPGSQRPPPPAEHSLFQPPGTLGWKAGVGQNKPPAARGLGSFFSFPSFSWGHLLWAVTAGGEKGGRPCPTTLGSHQGMCSP